MNSAGRFMPGRIRQVQVIAGITLDPAVDRFPPPRRLHAYCEISLSASLHPTGENATQPIEPRYGTLAVLLLLVGISPLRRRALPAHRIVAHSAVSYYRI
jgi:hypothetical protein